MDRARRAASARRAARPSRSGSSGTTAVSSVGGAKWCSACARGAPIASPILISPRPHTFPIWRAANESPLNGRAPVEDAEGGHLALVLADLQTISHAQRAREHADIGDPLARLAPLDLEDGARRRAVGVPFDSGQQLRDAAHQRVHAGAGDRRAEEHRVHERPFVCAASSCRAGRTGCSRPRRTRRGSPRRARRAPRPAAHETRGCPRMPSGRLRSSAV